MINIIASSHISSISPFEKLYGYAPDYSFFKVFGCTCFILKPHLLFLSFLVIVKVKSGICVLTQLLKNFVSRRVDFLEHIPFFSIPSSIHDLTRFNLIRIDPFYEDSNNLSSQVPSTLDTLSHILPHFPLHHT